MQRFISILLLMIAAQTLSAQKYVLKGKITDGRNNRALSFANVRVMGSTDGTSANSEGVYELRLKKSSYKIIVSYIGFKSDTANINLDKNTLQNFILSRVALNLPEVTVLPGKNPALAVIKKAIEAKKIREAKLNSYIFSAYTKGLVKTTKDISASDRSVGLSFGESDTAKLKITGIIENESKGYFLKPNNYKDEIIARKQSSNTPPTINILTGGRIIQNFYRDDIQFFNRPLPSPIADNALDYYYYYIEDTLAMDNMNIFQIYFAPDDDSDPGFYGRVFIADSIFSLVKIDVNLNGAANPGGIFTRINVFQQFLPYEDNIYMPIDYRVFVEGNFLGLAKFAFELNSIFYNYEINPEIDKDFFDMAIVTVMPDADKKDSLYWETVQSIPNTLPEIEAYKRIDSLESIPKTFWDNFSFLSARIQAAENISVTGPLELYHFNRVEGHALNMGVYLNRLNSRRFYGSLEFNYGFSDKKFKTDLFGKYFFGKYRTHYLHLHAFNKIDDLFGESNNYNSLTSTLFNLISKYDFRDYYYTKGFEAKYFNEIFPVLHLGIGFLNRTDNNGFVNTDFSIFNRRKIYRKNKKIFETKINAVKIYLRLDFRKYIEDGYFRRRISRNNFFPVINSEILISDNSTLKSSLNFEIYRFNLSGRLGTFKSAQLRYGAYGFYSDGPVPFQMMYALPGNIQSSGKDFSFRTLRIGEIFGDRVFAWGIHHEFGDELFRLLHIPVLKDLQLQLGTYFSMAWLDISPSSKSILLQTPKDIFRTPFMEIGFNIGHILIPLRFEFTWRLNHKGDNNFVFGINTFAL